MSGCAFPTLNYGSSQKRLLLADDLLQICILEGDILGAAHHAHGLSCNRPLIKTESFPNACTVTDKYSFRPEVCRVRWLPKYQHNVFVLLACMATTCGSFRLRH